MNIRNLLRNYHELFEEKVKEVYWMNGFYNFGCAVANDGWHGMLGPVNDCRGSAQETQLKWPHSVTEYFQSEGTFMCTGADFYNNKRGDDSNPVRRAFIDWTNQKWYKDPNCHPGRSSWDPLTVYAAIFGHEKAHMTAIAGTDEIGIKGHETFDTNWTIHNEFNLKMK